MANTYNRVILIGRIGYKSNIQFGKSKIPYIKLSLATESMVWNGNTITEWHMLNATHNIATYINNCINIGSLVFVEGRLQTKSYISNGVDKYITVVMVRRILKLVDSRRGDSHTNNSYTGSNDNDIFSEGSYDIFGGGPYAMGEFDEYGFRIEK